MMHVSRSDAGVFVPAKLFGCCTSHEDVSLNEPMPARMTDVRQLEDLLAQDAAPIETR